MSKKKLSLSSHRESVVAHIGIASKAKDYVLAHSLNSSTEMKLVRIKDIASYAEEGEISTSLYYYFDDQYQLKVFLLKNYNNGTYLDGSLRQFQFLMLFSKGLNDDKRKDLIKKIRATKGVLFVSSLIEEKYVNLPDLLDEIEMHLHACQKSEQEISRMKQQKAIKSKVKLIPNKNR